MDARGSRVLLVDDNVEFCALTEQFLERSGVECVSVNRSAAAVEILRDPETPRFDAVLLDVRMPEGSGWEVLEELRRAEDGTPVLFLSGSATVEERIRALEMGADDFLAKPFDYRELLARLGAVRRRLVASPEMRSGDVRIDPMRRVVEGNGERVELSPREFDLLRTLVSAGGATLARTDLLREVWSLEFDPGTTIVEVLVARLRRKLRSVAPDMIETVAGHGYRVAQPTS